MLQDGGELLIYVRKGLDFKHRKDLETPTAEVIWLELHLSNKSILLGVIYRPPYDNSNAAHTWLAGMEDMLSNAYSESENKSIIPRTFR